MKVEFALIDFIRAEGIVDEHRLAHQLSLTFAELHETLAYLLAEGYIRVINRKGTECQQCTTRLSCPGSQIHSKKPTATFKAYQLTSAGMRLHRSLQEERKS